MQWSAESAALELWKRLDLNQKHGEIVTCLKLHLQDAYIAGFTAAAEISDRVTRKASPETARDVMVTWIDELESESAQLKQQE